MRRPLLAMSIFASLAGVACEDGPNDPYVAAPANAGSVWNNAPDAGGYSSDATGSFEAATGSTTKIDICTTDQITTQRGIFFKAPIQPPGLAAGMDLAGGPAGDGKSGWNLTTAATWKYDGAKESWKGMTIDQAQVKDLLCQGSPSEVFVGISGMAWGDTAEVQAVYAQDTRKVSELVFSLGYLGSLDYTSDPKGPYGNKAYSLELKNPTPIQVQSPPGSGSPVDWTFTWNYPGKPGTVGKAINEMWDALRYTFAPAVPRTTDCLSSGECASRQLQGQNGKWSFPYIGLFIYVNAGWESPGTSANTFNYVRLDLLKILPFSDGNVTMQLDATGPYLDRKGLGDTGQTECKFTFGMTYKDFISNCVQTASDATINAANQAKIDGGRTHSDETFQIDLAGIDPQFTATLTDTQIVGDKDKPQDTDTGYSLTIDQTTIGGIANDYKNNDTTTGVKDLHGIGYVTLETAKLVQDYLVLQGVVTAKIGDAECASGATKTAAGDTCSGLEGILTSTPATALTGTYTSMAMNAAGVDAGKYGAGIKVGLRPATWHSYFCTDNTYANCVGDGSNYFKAFEDQLALTLGANLPQNVASQRFIFQQFMFASVKYFKATGEFGAYPTMAQVDGEAVNIDDLYFDSEGTGYEDAKYVDRTFVNKSNKDPLVITTAANLTGGTVDRWAFTQHNYRGEKALYTVLADNPTDHPGATSLLLANMVGAPMLTYAYGSYKCATVISTTSPNFASCGQLAPVNQFGEPLYKNYADAFGNSFLSLPPGGMLGGGAQVPVPVTIDESTYVLEQNAYSTIPIWSAPFGGVPGVNGNTNTKTGDYKVLVPFVPKGAGVGFPVTIDGSRDGFINTYLLDFTGGATGFLGGSISATLFYDHAFATDADSGVVSPNGILVKGIDTNDYLGLVFPCAEINASGTAYDVMGVRMYENAITITNYLATYPTAAQDCDIIIKYSPYGNYADYITSRANGIRMGFSPGSGGSVVTDLTVYDPNIASYLLAN
ncbi:MAG: hypothetical protein ACHREM_02085 [Polyangiales bacterium]